MTILDGAADDQTLNLTDADAPIMKGKKGYFDTNYNVQAACGENQLISYCNVVIDGNDKAQLIPALKGINEKTGKFPKIALADADYGTFNSLEYMEKQGIEGYVPYRDMNTIYNDKPYHQSRFTYNASTDTYTCPAGQSLLYYADYENKKRKHSYKKYRTDACKQCPFKSECLAKGTARRVIQRENREYLKAQMKQRLNSTEGKEIYQKRLHPIEAAFGHVKYNLGYQQFLLRGLEKVKAEFTLMCLVHNLRKIVAKLICFLYVLFLSRARHQDRKQYCTALQVTVQ